MFNLIFLLILILSDILVAVEQSNQRRIKNGRGNLCFKTFFRFALFSLLEFNELYSNNLTYYIRIIQFALKTQET